MPYASLKQRIRAGAAWNEAAEEESFVLYALFGWKISSFGAKQGP